MLFINGAVLKQAANQASTLGWGTRMKGFIACFVLGVLCSILVSRHLSPIISALLGLSIMCVSVSCVSQTSLSKPEHIDMFLLQKVLGLISEIFKSVH